jgi:hypothetical protein
MSSGEIVLWTLRGIPAAIPLVGTVFLSFYFLRPTDVMRKPGDLAFLVKKLVLYTACLILSFLWAAILLGVFKWGLSLAMLSLGAILLLIWLPLFVILVKAGARLRGYDTRRMEDEHKSFFEMLFGARKEFSEHCVDNYYRIFRDNPDKKKKLNRTANRAVKKDKINPEAQYVLAEYYMDSDEILKAQKHASIALELDPSNEKYKKLREEINKHFDSAGETV